MSIRPKTIQPKTTQSKTIQPSFAQLNLEDADGFYERLLDAHQGLSREQSESLNARLVLVMANVIGSSGALARCLAAAAQE